MTKNHKTKSEDNSHVKKNWISNIYMKTWLEIAYTISVINQFIYVPIVNKILPYLKSNSGKRPFS